MCDEEEIFDDGIDYEHMKFRMERSLEFMGELCKLGLKVSITLLDDNGKLEFNAHVHKVAEKEYEICFYKSLIDSIKNSVQFYLGHITNDDIAFMEIEDEITPTGSYSDFFSLDTKINKFYNYISSLILDNIIRHEVGHILLGHCDGENKTFYENDSKKLAGDFYLQRIEMEADWFGVIRGLTGNLDFDYKKEDFNIYKHKPYRLIKRLYLCYFIAIYVQYSLFFNNINWSKRSMDLSGSDFVNRDHACDLVRLRYSYDALINGLVTYLVTSRKINKKDAINYSKGMAEDFMTQLDKILNNYDRFTYKDILNNDTVEFYYYLVMYEKYSKNDYISKINYKFPTISKEKMVSLITEMAIENHYKELTEDEKNNLNL